VSFSRSNGRAVCAARASTYSGKHLQVEAGKLLFRPFQDPPPGALIFGGSSDAGIDVAAQLVDKYLTWGRAARMPWPRKNRRRLRGPREARSRAKALFSEIRLHVIVRSETAERKPGARRTS